MLFQIITHRYGGYSCLAKQSKVSKLFDYRAINKRFGSSSIKELGTCGVIGGNGFLGSNIVKQLSNKGYNVRVLDIQNELNENIIKSDNIEYMQCDITNVNDIYFGLKNIKTIFHSASFIDIRASPSPKLYQVNVNGTQNIINFCNDISNDNNIVNNLIYTSSIEVLNIDGIKEFCNVRENEMNVYGTNNFGDYGKTKCIAEEMIINNNKLLNSNLFTTAIRLGMIYGPFNNLYTKQSISKARKNPYAISTDSKLSSCYVGNAADAHIKIAELIKNNNVNGEVFHYKDLDTSSMLFVYKTLGVKVEDIKYIPYSIAIFVVKVKGFKQYFLHKWFGKLTGDRVDGTELSIKMASYNHTLNSDKFHKTIGYDPPFTTEEAIINTKKWIDSTLEK